jgi:exonuclease III
LDKLLKIRKIDMRFGTWNVKSFSRVGSFMTVTKELSKYKLDLVSVQEVRGEGGGKNQQTKTYFSMEREMRIMNLIRSFYLREPNSR